MNNIGRAATNDDKMLVTKSLYDVWVMFPNLRLGQLLGNVLPSHELYYIEDFDLAPVVMRKYIAILEGGNTEKTNGNDKP